MGHLRTIVGFSMALGVVLAGLGYGRIAYGEEYLGSKPVTKEQLLKLLKLPATEPSGTGNADASAPLTRSIAKVPKAELTNASSTAVGMDIRFDFASSALTKEAKRQLRPVGEALEDMPDQQFVVEGHTDAKGDPANNLRLSQKRADAVRRFLVDRYEIEPSRITVEGKGASAPLDPSKPESEVNRRVTFATHR